MLSRRFRKLFARLCVALLGMQAGIGAYACPAFLGDLSPISAQVSAHEMGQAPMGAYCDEQPAGNVADAMTLCHEHYAGDQSIGSGSLPATASPPALPVLTIGLFEPIPSTGGTILLPPLLARTTAPPLSIRFLVLRI